MLNELGRKAYENACAHGFSATNEFNFGEKCMLVVTEVAEAVEAWRKHQDKDIPEELADIIIRVVDMAYALHLDLDTAVETKMAKNEGRSYMHGGKRA